MKYTNYKQIDSIEFKYPDLMSKDAEDLIKFRFSEIQHFKDLIAQSHEVIDDLSKKLNSLEKQWEEVQPLIKVTYKEEEKEEVRGEINLGFNFGTDINKHIH